MGPDRTRISGWGTPQRPRHRDTSSRIRKWRRSGRKKILFTPREPILSSRYTVSSLYRTLFSNSHFVASLLTFRLPPREEKRRKKKEKKNGGVAYAVRVMDARWKRRRGRERRKRGAGVAVGRKRHNRKGWNETQRLLLCASMMGWPKRGMERENGRTGERDCGGAVNKTGIIQRSRSDFVRASTLLRFDSPLSLSLSSVVKFDGRRTRWKQMV